ncbi:MAG: S9 family peptidase [Armatimonadota bacterium]|nr:S9 family peptidase [Armatimonadota bacterium]MDR7534474.1 S9 family peptidase [Armatimonadota bacterium]MDR7535783.1 S9 family peptidase [Armatimonadota bacterium]
MDDVRLSPDGRQVAFVVSDGWRPPGRSPASDLMVVSASGGVRRVAADRRTVRMPRWRPGRSGSDPCGSERDLHGLAPSVSLAFVEQTERDTVIGLAYVEDGSSTDLARFPGVVSAVEWSPDGRLLAALHTDPPTVGAFPGDDVVRGDAAEGWTRLWVIDVEAADARPVSPPGLQIWEFDWAPDSRGFAVVAAASPGEGAWYQAWLAVLSLDGRPSPELVRGHRQIVRPAWSPDGRWIAFLSCLLSDRDMGSGDIWVIPPSGGAARNLTPGYPATPTWIAWLDGARLLWTGYEDCDAVVGTVSLDGRIHRVWREHVGLAHPRWPRVSVAAGGRLLAAAREAWDQPLDVWLAELRGGDVLQWRRLTALHQDWAAWPLGPAEIVAWEAPDGLEVHGILLRPPHPPAGGGPMPMVTAVHGGPTHLWGCRPYLLWHRLLTVMGALVFLPNPRGSTGRGVAFAEANHADYGGGDWHDILAGIDALVTRGAADARRLGIGGWSYGGFMTAWAVTQTDRFRAAAMGAGISNWVSFHGTTPLHTWDALAFDADPHRDPAHARRSPITHVGRARTPTLIVHGLSDTVAPAGQSMEFFRALRDRGVPAELYLYPREPHFFTEKAHQCHLYQHTLDWFARHLDLDASVLDRIPDA